MPAKFFENAQKITETFDALGIESVSKRIYVNHYKDDNDGLKKFVRNGIKTFIMMLFFACSYNMFYNMFYKVCFYENQCVRPSTLIPLSSLQWHSRPNPVCN